jgi:hypothetical protein
LKFRIKTVRELPNFTNTRADRKIAEELVEGLVCDLIARVPAYWDLMPDYPRTRFETAARRALGEEARTLGPGSRAAERLIRAISRAAPVSPTGA